MPTRNIVLTDHQAALVERLVSSGRYQNASEVLRQGLRLLERLNLLQAWARMQARMQDLLLRKPALVQPRTHSRKGAKTGRGPLQDSLRPQRRRQCRHSAGPRPWQ